MNLILFRHGEATDNVKELISDKEIYWSTLTENGKKDVIESIGDIHHIFPKAYLKKNKIEEHPERKFNHKRLAGV